MKVPQLRRRIIPFILLLLSICALAILVVLFVFLSGTDRSVLFGTVHAYKHNNTDRTYRLHLPKDNVTQIIVGLHGFGGDGRQFAYYTGLHNVVDDNTMVVYPDAIRPTEKGVKPGWNAGFCCGSGWVTKTDDAGFITELVRSLSEQYHVTSENFFATGFSNGAFMTQRLATDYPTFFTAIAVSSGAIGTEEARLTPQKPARILLQHGEQDTIVPFSGGAGSSDPDFSWLSFEETQQAWFKANKNATETKVITHPTDSHNWHDWRLFNIWHKRPQGSIEVANFFKS